MSTYPVTIVSGLLNYKVNTKGQQLQYYSTMIDAMVCIPTAGVTAHAQCFIEKTEMLMLIVSKKIVSKKIGCLFSEVKKSFLRNTEAKLSRG